MSRTSAEALTHVLRAYEEVALEEAREDPWKLMPRQVLEQFGSSLDAVAASLDGAYYFHGTRAIDPDAFRRRGILPLGQMVDELWAALRDLAGSDVNDGDWAVFRRDVETGGGGDSGTLYRHKTGAGVDEGPFGLVVREIFFRPQASGSHDYLGCPEIVQDIARCFAFGHGINLEERFCGAARPCTVKFRSTQLRPGAVCAALWFIYTFLRDGEITTSSNYSFDGDGVPVPAEDVVEVEVAG